jgi:hypothetical protein
MGSRMNEDHTAEKDVPAYGPADLYATAGELLATEVGKWVVAKGLDRPKRIIRLIHNESTTSIQWYRNPEKPDGISGMVARHDHEVLIYNTQPTSVLPPAGGGTDD